MARYRIPGKNYSRRSIFGITAIVVVVAALVAAGVAVAVLPSVVDGHEGSEFVTDGGYTRPVVTAIVLENDGRISVNANLENVFATVQYSDGSVEQVALSEMLIEGLDLTQSNTSSDVVLDFGGFKQSVVFEVIPTTLTVTYIAGEGGSVEGDLIQEVIAGEDATTVRAVPDAGYEFVRWTDGYPEPERRDRAISKTTTLQAVFRKQTFTVVFFYPDGTTAREETVQYNMSPTDIPDPDEGEMRLYGYRFAGWDTDYSHITQDTEIHPIMVKHAIDLNFTATSDGDGALGGIQDIMPYYPIGQQTVLRLTPNMERVFLGWEITDKDGSVVEFPADNITGEGYSRSVSLFDSISVTFTAGQTGTEGRNEYTLSFTIPEGAVTGTFDLNIHAEFAYSESRVTFVSQGTSSNLYSAELNYGTPVGTLFAEAESRLPERSGYEFAGWYYELNESGAPDVLDGDEFIAMDATLTALWESLSYDVKFILDGIDNAEDFEGLDGYFNEDGNRGIRLRVKYSDTLESAVSGTIDGVEYGVYPAVAPEKENYIFNGWYVVDANGAMTETAAAKDYIVSGDTTLRAKFLPRTVNVKIVADGGVVEGADNVSVFGSVMVPVTEDFSFRTKPNVGYSLGDILWNGETYIEAPVVGEDGYFDGSIAASDLQKVDTEATLTIIFIPENNRITIEASGGGGTFTYNLTGAAGGETFDVAAGNSAYFEVPDGSSVTIAIRPSNIQQRISSVSVDSAPEMTVPQSEYNLILEAVDADKNIVVEFENVYYSIDYPTEEEWEGYSINSYDVTAGMTHLQGSNVKFTVTAEEGKYISEVRVNGTFMDVYNLENGLTAYCTIDEFYVNGALYENNAPVTGVNDYRITAITFNVAGIMQNTVISVAAEDMYYNVSFSVVDESGNSVDATLSPGGSFTEEYGSTASVDATVQNIYYIYSVYDSARGETELLSQQLSAYQYTTEPLTGDTEIVFTVRPALRTITFSFPAGIIGIEYNSAILDIGAEETTYTVSDIVNGGNATFRLYVKSVGYQLDSVSSVSDSGTINEDVGFRVTSHTMTFNSVESDYEVNVRASEINYDVEIFAVNKENVTISIAGGSPVSGDGTGEMLELTYDAYMNGSAEISIMLTGETALSAGDIIVMNATGGDYGYIYAEDDPQEGGYYKLEGGVSNPTLTVYRIASDVTIYLNIHDKEASSITFGASGAGSLTAEKDGAPILSGTSVSAGEEIIFKAVLQGTSLLGFMIDGSWVSADSSEIEYADGRYVYTYVVAEGVSPQVFAFFGELRYPVIIDTQISGGTVRTEPESVSGGETLRIKFIPDEGYKLKSYSLTYNATGDTYEDWAGLPGEGASLTAEYTINENYNGSVTVRAVFEPITFSVEWDYDAQNGSAIVPDAATEYEEMEYGSVLRLEIKANSGQYISSITVNGLEYGAENLSNASYDEDLRKYTSGTLEITVRTDIYVVISYSPGVYTLSIRDNPGGVTYASCGNGAYGDVDSLSFTAKDVIKLKLEAEEGYHIESIRIHGEIYDEWLDSVEGIEDEVRQLVLTLTEGDELRGEGLGNIDIEVTYRINVYDVVLSASNSSPNFADFDRVPADFGTVTIFGEAAADSFAVEHGANILVVVSPVRSKRYIVSSMTVNGVYVDIGTGDGGIQSTGGNYLINVTDDIEVEVVFTRETYGTSLTDYFNNPAGIEQTTGVNAWAGEFSLAFTHPNDSSREVIASAENTYEYGLRYVLTANPGTGYNVESLMINGEESKDSLGSAYVVRRILGSSLEVQVTFAISFYRVEYTFSSAEAFDSSGALISYGSGALNVTRRDESTLNLFDAESDTTYQLVNGGLVRDITVDGNTLVAWVSYGSELTFIATPSFADRGGRVSDIDFRSANSSVGVDPVEDGQPMTLTRRIAADSTLSVEFDITVYEFKVTSGVGGSVVLTGNMDGDMIDWHQAVTIALTLSEGYELPSDSVAVYIDGVLDEIRSADARRALSQGSWQVSLVEGDYDIHITPARKHVKASFGGNYKVSHGSAVADSRLTIARSGRVFGTTLNGTLTEYGEGGSMMATLVDTVDGEYVGILYNDSVTVSLTPLEGYTVHSARVTITSLENGATLTEYTLDDFNGIPGTEGKSLTVNAAKGNITIDVSYEKKSYELDIVVAGGIDYGSFVAGELTPESGAGVSPIADGGQAEHYDSLRIVFRADYGYYISSFMLCNRRMEIGSGASSDYIVSAEKNDSNEYVYTASFEVNASILNNSSVISVSVTFAPQQFVLETGYTGNAASWLTPSPENGSLSYNPAVGSAFGYTLAEGYEITAVTIYSTSAWSADTANPIGILDRIDALTSTAKPGINEYLSRTPAGSPAGELTMRIDIGKELTPQDTSSSVRSIVDAMDIHSGAVTVYIVFSVDTSKYDIDFDGAYAARAGDGDMMFGNGATGNITENRVTYIRYDWSFSSQGGTSTILTGHSHGTTATLTIEIPSRSDRRFVFEGIQEYVGGSWVYLEDGDDITIERQEGVATVSYTMKSTRTFRIIFYEMIDVNLKMTPLYKYVGGNFASENVGSLNYSVFASVSASATYSAPAGFDNIVPNVAGLSERLTGTSADAATTVFSVRFGGVLIPSAVDTLATSSSSRANISFYTEPGLDNIVPENGISVTETRTLYGADTEMNLLLSVSSRTQGEDIGTRGGTISGASISDGSIVFNPGDELSFTLQPNAGYRVGAVGFLPDTGTPGAGGRRQFASEYVMMEVPADNGGELSDDAFPFTLIPGIGGNYTLRFNDSGEGMVIRILFIKQITLTRSISLLDGYESPVFFNQFKWAENALWESTDNDDSASVIIDYGTQISLQVQENFAAVTSSDVRYRFVGYLINGVMQDLTLSRAYPGSTQRNFTISDDAMNGATVAGGSGVFTVEVVALYQPVYTIVIDNVFFDTDGRCVNPGSVTMRTYLYDHSRVQYVQNTLALAAATGDSGANAADGKLYFRVLGGINGNSGNAYNTWNENMITLNWGREGYSEGFVLRGWEVYAYDGSGWSWKQIGSGNNFSFEINALFEESYLRYVNTNNEVDNNYTNISGGLKNHTDEGSGYVYGIPEGSAYDDYCIMIRPVFEKQNTIYTIPEVASIYAGNYIPYESDQMNPPVRPSINGNTDSLQKNFSQGTTAVLRPNVSNEYVFEDWWVDIIGEDGSVERHRLEAGSNITLSNVANRNGEPAEFTYSLTTSDDTDKNALSIVMNDHYKVYARYTAQHKMTISATNITATSFNAALPKLNISYKRTPTSEAEVLVNNGVPTDALEKYGFTFVGGVFSGMVAVGGRLTASLSVAGYSSEPGEIDFFNPRYDRFSDVHIQVSGKDIFGTGQTGDDADQTSLRTLEQIQAYLSGNAVGDGAAISYEAYAELLETFSLEIVSNSSKTITFDFISYGEINIEDVFTTGVEGSTAGVKLPAALAEALGYDGDIWVYDGDVRGVVSDADGIVDGNIRIANVPIISGSGYDNISGDAKEMDFWLRIRHGDGTIITLDNSDIGRLGISFSEASAYKKISRVSLYGTDSSGLTSFPFGNKDAAGDHLGGGDGTLGAPFLIYTAEHLNSIDRIYKGNDGVMSGIYFRLEADINLSGSAFGGRLTADVATVQGTNLSMGFTGTLDGNGHSITNISINISGQNDYVGLFSKIGNGGSVSKLRLSGSVIAEQGNYVGMLAGYVMGGRITDVTIFNPDVSSGQNQVYGNKYVGGLVGYITGTSGEQEATISFGADTETVVLESIVVYAYTGGTYDSSSKNYTGGVGGIAGAMGAYSRITGDYTYTGEIPEDEAAAGELNLDLDLLSANAILRSVVVVGQYASGILVGSVEDRTNTASTEEGSEYDFAVSGFKVEYATGDDQTQSGKAALGGAIGFIGYKVVVGLLDVNIVGTHAVSGDRPDNTVQTFTEDLARSLGVGGLAGNNIGTIRYSKVTGGGLLDVEAGAVGGVAGVNFGTIENVSMEIRLKVNRRAPTGERGLTAALGGIAGVNWTNASIIDCEVAMPLGTFGDEEALEADDATLEMITGSDIYDPVANGGMGGGLYSQINYEDATNIYVGLATGYNGGSAYVSGGNYVGKILVNRRNNDVSTGQSYVGGAVGYSDSTVASTGITTNVHICFFQYLYVDSDVDENVKNREQILNVGGIYGKSSGAEVSGTYDGARIYAAYLGGGDALSQGDLDQSSWTPSNAYMTGTNVGAARINVTAGELTKECLMPADPSGSILKTWYYNESNECPKWVHDDVLRIKINWAATDWLPPDLEFGWGYMYAGNGRYVNISP